MTKLPDFAPYFPGVHYRKISEFFSTRGGADRDRSWTEVDIPKSDAYFICFTNRCGSNFVAQALSTDGKLSQAGENLNFDTVINQSTRMGFLSFHEYFSWLVNTTRGRSAIFGCKVSIEQLLILASEDLFSKFFAIPKFIHITRSDVVSQAISMYIATKTSRWTSEDIGRQSAIEYDSGAIVAIVKSIYQQNAMFEALFQIVGVTPLSIRYEDFVARPGANVSKVGRFLGIPDLRFDAEKLRYRKQADDLNHEFMARFRMEYSLTIPQDRSVS